MIQVVKAPDGRRLPSAENLGAPEGKPVFLLHGTPGGHNSPRPSGIFLYRLAIRLMSYDRPGYPGLIGTSDAASQAPPVLSRLLPITSDRSFQCCGQIGRRAARTSVCGTSGRLDHMRRLPCRSTKRWTSKADPLGKDALISTYLDGSSQRERDWNLESFVLYSGEGGK